MSLDQFAPLSPDEIETTDAPKAKASAKVPIVPVPGDAPKCTFRHPEFGSPAKLWAYHDAEGRLLGYDARFEYLRDGKPHKDVLPLTFCEIGEKRGWRSKAMPTPRALYGLDHLARRPDASVVVAEGCKSADAAALLLPDHVVVTWSGGSKATALSDWSSLAGRRVIIWPDRDRQRETGGDELPYEDQPGTITASNIVQRLRGIASEIRVLDLANWECTPGWDAADALAEGWGADRAAAFLEERAIDIETAGFGVTIPFPFEYGADGIYNAEKAATPMRVCGRLKLLAQTRDQDGSGWGLLLEWRDYDGRRHLWSMPKSMLAGDGSAVREALLERGLYVNTASSARTALMQFLGSVTTTVRARAVAKVGWSGRSFVLPHTTIGDTPTERVIFQHSEAPPHHYQSAGTLAGWQESLAKLAMDNSRLTFAISSAFVGPILALAAEEGGGFNIVGASSCGRTTCMTAAVSVWGPPKFMRTWRATGNGLEGIAAQHSETFLALDELGQLDPNEAGHVAYMLANGAGKQRSSRTGQSRAVTTWNVSYLSTGEIGLADLVKQGRRERTAQAGQEVRILDIPADAGKNMGAFETLNGGAPNAEAFSRIIKSAAAEHYGVAADAYLAAIASRRVEIEGWISAALSNFMSKHSPKDADGQVLRAVRRFALVATAGEIAIKLGILPWPPGHAFKGASETLQAWLGRRGGTGSAEDRNIIAQFRAFFEAHADTRFDPADPPEGWARSPVLNRAGFWSDVRLPNKEWERQYLVLPQAFREIGRGFDLSAVTAALAKIGALRTLRPDGRGCNNRRIKALDGDLKAVYAIGPEIFETGEIEIEAAA